MPCGLFFSSYRKDDAIFKTWWLRIWMAVLFIFLITYPLYSEQANEFTGMNVTNMFNLIFIYIIGAHGLNLLTGYTGQISLGHGAFMGVGAYTAGILANMGWPFYLALPAAGLMAAAVGMIFGLPSLRLRGLYLAIATLAAQFILDYAMRNWSALTGGSAGLTVPYAKIFSQEFNSDNSFYFLALFFAVLATLYLKNITRTRTGRAFVAVRDRYLAAEVIGVNLFKYRILSFGISSFMVGIAGGLWAYYITIISDEHFTLWLSVQFLAMVIVGGLGHVLGGIFGAIFFVVLPELLRLPAEALTDVYPNIFGIFASLREMVFGLIVILFLIFEPDGLAARWHTMRAYWKLWPFSY
ncbi:MAG: branched-chain amino acid ABC transporter permease [Pseudomonadota bacterium]